MPDEPITPPTQASVPAQAKPQAAARPASAASSGGTKPAATTQKVSGLHCLGRGAIFNQTRSRVFCHAI
jgi:hypothetical protein